MTKNRDLRLKKRFIQSLEKFSVRIMQLSKKFNALDLHGKFHERLKSIRNFRQEFYSHNPKSGARGLRQKETIP